MSARPLLGITCCNRRVGEETAQAVMTRYVEAAMRHAAADAVLIPALPGLIDAFNIVRGLDGLLLTGSPSNLAPHRYGQADGAGPFDEARDAVALALVAAARGKPIFGICRGFQELNVALGGTLRRDVGHAPGLAHHAPDGTDFAAMFEHRHPVTLTPNGVLAQAFGVDRIDVNSVHYQGLDRVASGLEVEARAPDGLVEAVSGEIDGAPLLAVQWHPEWACSEDPHARTFFHLMGRALRGARHKELGS